MDIRVQEGRLAEAPTAEATGMDRRAFGEFVGPGGELASYAFGWTTGSDPHVARLSIGIGAGNPGDGTFHAVVFEHEDGHAFSLTDEPFEHVPQGGPDLTAGQARAHEDLPFVWWVADHVMERDRRARWMRHWLLGTRCIRTVEVFELRAPVLLVRNDAGDGGDESLQVVRHGLHDHRGQVDEVFPQAGDVVVDIGMPRPEVVTAEPPERIRRIPQQFLIPELDPVPPVGQPEPVQPRILPAPRSHAVHRRQRESGSMMRSPTSIGGGSRLTIRAERCCTESTPMSASPSRTSH